MLNVFNQSLWGDEGFSAILSMKPVVEIISIITRDTSPPLFNLSEHFWFKIFSTSEISIRSLVFLFFLIACFFTYKIAARLWDRKTGILAAALTFLNPFFFSYAFEGRMYSLLAATVTASMYFFLKKKWKMYIITAALALYSHHFAIFAIFTQGLWFLIDIIKSKGKLLKTGVFVYLGIFMLYAPWIFPLYLQTKMVAGGFWLGTPTITDLGNLMGKYLGKGLPHPLSSLGLYLTLSVLILRKWSLKIQGSLFLLSWFLVPILATWGLSQKMQSIFFDRYLLYTIPAAMVILSSNLRRVSLGPIFLIIFIFLAIDANYFTHPTKRPFRDLAAYVLENKRGDDYLLNWNAASHHLWESKYYKIPAPLYIPEGKPLPFYVGTALMTKEDIVSAVPPKIGPNKTNRLGIITSGNIDDVHITGYNKTEVKTFGDLKFVWLEKLIP